MNDSFRKKIAVIRALDVRLIQAEFAAQFKKLKPVYISNYKREIAVFSKKVGLDYLPLPLTPSMFFDPLSIIFDKPVNKSWLHFDRKKLEKVLEGVDFFQIQEPYFIYSGQVAEIARKTKKPLICAPWTCFLHPSTFIPPYSFSVRKVIKQTDLFIARSKRANRYLAYFKIPERKKVLIYHGVDLERFYPVKKKKGEKVKILFAGQLTQHKGIDDLLDVYPQLVKAVKEKVQLVICGKGEYEERIKKMSETLPIEYLGYVPSHKLPKIYRNSDIFCGPSKDWYSFGIKRTEEGFGFVFLEAMASGLPIVTNRCGAVEEVVGEDNFLNEQGDKNKLLSSLLTLINDDNMRLDIGVKNRKRVEELFDIKKQVAKEEEVIIKKFC